MLDKLMEAQKEVVRANNLEECYLRPIAFYGSEKMGVSPKGAKVHVAIAAWPWGTYLGDDGEWYEEYATDQVSRVTSDLLFALYNHAFGLYYTEQLQGSQIPDPVDRLRADCRHYVLWGLAHPKLYELMYILDVPMDVIAREQCVDIGRRSFEVLREVVGRAVAAGRLRIKDTELATTLLWNLLHGIVSLILKRRVLVRPEELHRTVDAMIDTELLLLVR